VVSAVSGETHDCSESKGADTYAQGHLHPSDRHMPDLQRPDLVICQSCLRAL